MVAYPSSVPNLTKPGDASGFNDGSSTDGTVLVGQIIDELQAVATELGANPSGSASTVASRLAALDAGTYNVKNYGAVGDGVTDDTSAIAQAVAAASAAGGGRVVLPPGSYLTDPITLASNVELSGCGESSVIVMRSPSNQIYIKAYGSNGSSRNLTADAAAGSTSVLVASATGLTAGSWVLIGDNAEPDPAYAGRKAGELVRIASIDGLTINLQSPLAFSFTTANSAFMRPITPVRNVGVTDLKVVNPYPGSTFVLGAYFARCVGVYVRNVRMEGMDNAGLGFEACAEFTVDNLTSVDFSSDDVGGRYGYGIMVIGACTAGEVRNSRFINVRHGFTTGGVDAGYGQPTDITVSDCHAIGCKLAGFDTHAAASGITFIGCTARGGNATYQPPGFQIRSNRTHVTACRVYDISGSGITITGGAQDVTVSGCDFRGVTNSGMYVDGDASGLSVIGNVFSDFGLHGIYFETTSGGTGIIVEDNTFRDYSTGSGHWGIYVNGPVDFPVFQGNTFQNGYAAINITASPGRPYITDNRGYNMAAGSSWLSYAGSTYRPWGNRLDNSERTNNQIDTVTHTSAGTVLWNAGISNYHRVVLQANATDSFIGNAGNAGRDEIITLEIVQDATGGWTFTPPSLCKFAGGAAPTWSTTANYIDIVTFVRDSGSGYYLETSRSIGIR